MSKHDLEQKKALIELMNNEPLMSAELYYDNNNNDKLNTSELMKAYATYHTNWHLRQCSEVIPQDIKPEFYGGEIVGIDKQSITNAIENYIKENL